MGVVKIDQSSGRACRSWGCAVHGWRGAPVLAALLLLPSLAHASEFEDTLADVLTWAVLVLAPVIGITLFLLIHILPEKFAEQKRHPQAKAIQVMCLLSLVFGGMLWPIAWLWAFTKPVMYKMAYGTDVHGDESPAESGEAPDGTLPVLTREAEVPVRAAQARTAKSGG